MKTNFSKISAALLAVGLCVWSTEMRAQSTTIVTTTKGAFTEFVPGTETVVVRSETNPNPLRYTVTRQTTIVDESGAPVAIENISPGSPLSVEYASAGERQVASRIVVHRPATTAVTTTNVPDTTAPVTARRSTTTTTTTTTRPLTHEEMEAREEAREDRKEQAEKAIERREEAIEKASEAEKERLEKMKDKLDDDH
jgi:hypothetical protein